jgi:hypothetical protein|tara:strand:- start:2656 stop:2910 length:255 start_codon:yes stop_codon:yes gene_type:complete
MEYSETIDGLEIEIEYLYDEGEPTVWTEPNGDPGTPGYPPSVEILTVFTLLKDRNNNDVMVDILPIWDYDLETLEEEIIERNHG